MTGNLLIELSCLCGQVHSFRCTPSVNELEYVETLKTTSFSVKKPHGSEKLVFVRNTSPFHSSLESRDEIPVRGVEL